MKPKIAALLLSFASLVLGTVFWGYYIERGKAADPIYCRSDSRIVEQGATINSRYVVLMNKGTGMFSINGMVNDGEKKYTLSRQVHFLYQQSGDGYTLKSTQIERINGVESEKNNIDQYFPSFFSAPGRLLTLAMDSDRYGNQLMSFGDVPVFYCIQRRVMAEKP